MAARQQIGGSDAETELAGLSYEGGGVAPIGERQFAERRALAAVEMRACGLSAMLLVPGANLLYFSGVRLRASERLTAAVLRDDGSLAWVAPHFEEPVLRRKIGPSGPVSTWQEEEDPFALLPALVADGGVAIDETAPYWVVDRIFASLGRERCSPATPITSGLRMIKSSEEIAIISHVMGLTLEVQRRAARILRPGIGANEVRDFINDAHLRLTGSGSTFAIVSFGEETAYPHGGSGQAYLQDGDMVLIDTGTTLHGYHSDITRSYVFGTATPRQRQVWDAEQGAQRAAFAAARLGVACEAADHAARAFLAGHGFGPDYQLPGLPHRTGHGLGLDIHEHPYLVRGNSVPLRPGMCFSNEPMICIYGEFGVRLEDHIYMSDEGANWFTQPSRSIEQPFET